VAHCNALESILPGRELLNISIVNILPLLISSSKFNIVKSPVFKRITGNSQYKCFGIEHRIFLFKHYFIGFKIDIRKNGKEVPLSIYVVTDIHEARDDSREESDTD
jgi:hypothetical protein